MKRTAAVMAVLIAAFLMMQLCGCFAFSKREQLHTEEELQKQYGYQSLAGEEREFYRSLDAYIYASQSLPFTAPYSVDIQRMSEIVDIYCSDYPEVCWIDEETNITSLGSFAGRAALVSLNYRLEGSEMKEAHERLLNRADSIVSMIPQGASEYEKELFINDYLVENCTYDSEAAEKEEELNVYAVGTEHLAYGALVNGKAVCDGYSRAFKLLCDRAGIDSLVISGSAEGYAHAWNAAKIEGEWYYIDVTWNDNDGDEELELERRLYFNLTGEMMSADHELAPLYSERDGYEAIFYNVYLPECTSTEYNYVRREFVKYGKGSSLRTIGFDLAEAAKNGSDFFCFWVDDSIDYQGFIDDMIDGTAWDLLQQANRINKQDPVTSTDSFIYTCDPVRAVILKLEYV